MQDADPGPALEDMTVAMPSGVLFQQIDEGMVLLNITDGEYYGLNEVGARVWALLLEGQPPGQVLDTMLGEFDVTPERLRSDIQQFLLQLQSRDLIELSVDPQT